MNGVHIRSTELGHLVVCLPLVLLLLETSPLLLPAVGDDSTPLPSADKVSSEAIQLEQVCPLLVCGDPGFTQVDDVCLQDVGVNLEVLHVGLQPGDVEGDHPDRVQGVLVPDSWVLVQGPAMEVGLNKYIPISEEKKN